MPSTTVAWGTFPSRKAADQAIQRLVSGGFARNSIELQRHGDDEGYDLAVHTRQRNLPRAESLIHASASGQVLKSGASGALQAAKSHPMLLLGAGVLAGFAIYSLLPGGERSSKTPPRSRQRQAHNR
jgi:hypothetical protein